MILTTLVVQHFRLFEQQTYNFHPKLTIIIGENTRGKTSLLEAVYTIIFGEGFRETKENELVQWEAPQCNIAASFVSGDLDMGDVSQFQVMFRVMDERVEKAYFVDKTKKTHYTYLQFLTRAVLFTPSDIEIITAAPSERRKYFDKILSAADIEYKKRLTNYENALRKRNKILETIRNEDTLEEELAFWDGYLAEQSAYLVEKREEYMQFLNDHPDLDDRKFSITYIKNELTVERLREKRDLEKRMKKTSIGPQKDDVELYLIQADVDGKSETMSKNVRMYGSRSEQRLAMFWLKLNEIAYLEEKTGKKPLLLLDDVFSELDQHNKKRIMHLMKGYQTILTTTEEELVDMAEVTKEVIRL